VGIALDLEGENAVRPTMLDGLAHIPDAGAEVFDPLKEQDVV
jgi:hypothetical protein